MEFVRQCYKDSAIRGQKRHELCQGSGGVIQMLKHFTAGNNIIVSRERVAFDIDDSCPVLPLLKQFDDLRGDIPALHAVARCSEVIE